MIQFLPSLRKSLALTGLTLHLGLLAAGPASADWTLDGSPVCTDPQVQQNPAIVSDGAGGVIVFWEDSRFGNSDIYAQRLDGNGATLWSNQGVPVCSAAGAQIEPAAAMTSLGGAVVVWTDARNASGAAHYDIYGQRVDPSGVPQWATNGIPLASSNDFEATPQIISDFNPGHIGTPGFILAYARYSSLLSLCEYDVQHVSSLGDNLWTSAASGGVRLSSPQNSSNRRAHLSIATDGLAASSVNLGVVGAWQELNPQTSSPSHIRLNRANSQGALQWGVSGVSVTATLLSQDFPSVANLGAVTVTSWSDSRSGSSDIYAQKLDGVGARQWLPDGVPACRATGTQSSPVTIAGASGSSIIVWRDSRSGEVKLYAQRLDSNGQALWVADGIPLCGAPGDQTGQRAIPDGAGGVIVVWRDRRGASYDIFAQRIDQDGNVLWGSNAVPVCAHSGDQFNPALTGDGNSGAFVTWMDNRTAGTTDIYAVRSYNTTNVSAVPDELPAQFGLELISRNPGAGPALLSLDLPEAAAIRADVFDISGRRIQSLVAEEPLAAGSHQLRWDGDDARGISTPAGLYFVRVRIGSQERVIKIVRTG